MRCRRRRRCRTAGQRPSHRRRAHARVSRVTCDRAPRAPGDRRRRYRSVRARAAGAPRRARARDSRARSRSALPRRARSGHRGGATRRRSRCSRSRCRGARPASRRSRPGRPPPRRRRWLRAPIPAPPRGSPPTSTSALRAEPARTASSASSSACVPPRNELPTSTVRTPGASPRCRRDDRRTLLLGEGAGGAGEQQQVDSAAITPAQAVARRLDRHRHCVLVRPGQRALGRVRARRLAREQGQRQAPRRDPCPACHDSGHRLTPRPGA